MNFMYDRPVAYRLTIFNVETKKHSYEHWPATGSVPPIGSWCSNDEKLVGIMPVYEGEYEA